MRQRLCKKQVTRGNKNDESPNNDPIPHTGIYDIPEDNAGYQELSHVTGRSHYDQLQRPNWWLKLLYNGIVMTLLYVAFYLET